MYTLVTAAESQVLVLVCVFCIDCFSPDSFKRSDEILCLRRVISPEPYYAIVKREISKIDILLGY